MPITLPRRHADGLNVHKAKPREPVELSDRFLGSASLAILVLGCILLAVALVSLYAHAPA